MYFDEKAPKYWLQSLLRGYSDRDLWAMNDFIVREIRKPLKVFIKNAIEEGYGVPSKLVNENLPGNTKTGFCGVKIENKKVRVGKMKSDKDLRKEWVSILKKIDRAFDLYYETEIKSTKVMGGNMKQWKEIEEGFELFGRYLASLWD